MASQVPANLFYTKDHEWARVESDVAYIGITDFAQGSLGDIVFVELPAIGKNLNKQDAFGVVESVKSVSDLYAPLSGEVIEVNSELESAPELLNQNPYENWIVKIKISNNVELSNLLSAEQYKNQLDA